MADYNVNMKQWNGSSFDNVLPLAFNSKALDGKSYDDIIQYAQSKNLLLYTGQYMGMGTYGINNPTTLTFPFEPILFIAPDGLDNSYRGPAIFCCSVFTQEYKYMYFNGYDEYMKKDSNAIIFYNRSSAANQKNASGKTYYYAAIGGYDMGGVNEWTITSSGTWTVPKTGKYYIELYGGGGNSTYQGLYQGGSSCQSYDLISLTSGDVINVTIGTGALSTATADGGTTTFGQYLVAGGKRASSSSGGAGSGNKGTDGGWAGSYNTMNPSSGKFNTLYGFGSNGGQGKYGNAGNGAVYLKYLGE